MTKSPAEVIAEKQKKAKEERAKKDLTDEEFLAKYAPPLSEWVKIEPPKGNWLINNWVLKGGLNLLSGQEKKSGKTLLALQLAHVVATEHRGNLFECHKQGNVLYVLGEMPHGIIRDRVIATARGYKEEVSSNIYWSYLQDVEINKPANVRNLERIITITEPKMIVLDTIFCLHSCDENDNSEVRKILDVVQRWQGWGCAILMLCHLNKSHGMNPDAPIDQQVRGGSALTGAYDYHIAARKYTDHGPRTIQFGGRENTLGDGEIFWDFDNRLRDIGEGLNESYLHTVTCEFITEEGKHRENCAEAVEMAQELEEGKQYTAEALRMLWGFNDIASSKPIRTLLTGELGLIEKVGAKYKLRRDPQKPEKRIKK
jgi:hypothetical protein